MYKPVNWTNIGLDSIVKNSRTLKIREDKVSEFDLVEAIETKTGKIVWTLASQNGSLVGVNMRNKTGAGIVLFGEKKYGKIVSTFFPRRCVTSEE